MARGKKETASNNQFMLLLLAIVIFLIVISVVCVCIYLYMKKNNNKVNTITNTITMNYTSNTNGILVPYTSVYDDATGKLLQNEENVFDFVVNAKVAKNTKVEYEIVAIKDDLSTIPDDKVKIYLQKSDVSSYTSLKEVFLPQKYDDSKVSNITNTKSMVLEKGSYKKTSTVYYRLKLWVDPSYVSVTSSDYFKLKVNIYANVK